MKAIVLGATGATGKDLMQCLLADASVEGITVLARRQICYDDPRVKVCIVNFDKPEEWKHLVTGDVLFSMLGTTLKAAGSKEAQWKVDYTYQYDVAAAARANGVNSMILMSAMSASAKSPFFYLKMKGQLEDDVIKLGFPRIFIVRPPSLIRKQTDRRSEKTTVFFLNLLNKIGLFRSYTPVPTMSVATQMLNGAKTNTPALTIVNAEEVVKNTIFDDILIRQSRLDDIPVMQDIFATARAFMVATGNPNQWSENYPSVELLREDIASGDSYVIVNGGRIVATFVLRGGIDSTYNVIYDGKWLDDSPYATIHRIASNGEMKGIFKYVMKFALQHYGSIRIDTHADNKVMQNAVLKEGFKYCGIIHCWNGSERLAYQIRL